MGSLIDFHMRPILKYMIIYTLFSTRATNSEARNYFFIVHNKKSFSVFSNRGKGEKSNINETLADVHNHNFLQQRRDTYIEKLKIYSTRGGLRSKKHRKKKERRTRKRRVKEKRNNYLTDKKYSINKAFFLIC